MVELEIVFLSRNLSLRDASSASVQEVVMNSIIYVIGLIVVVVVIAGFFGFHLT